MLRVWTAIQAEVLVLVQILAVRGSRFETRRLRMRQSGKIGCEKRRLRVGFFISRIDRVEVIALGELAGNRHLLYLEQSYTPEQSDEKQLKDRSLYVILLSILPSSSPIGAQHNQLAPLFLPFPSLHPKLSQPQHAQIDSSSSRD